MGNFGDDYKNAVRDQISNLKIWDLLLWTLLLLNLFFVWFFSFEEAMRWAMFTLLLAYFSTQKIGGST